VNERRPIGVRPLRDRYSSRPPPEATQGDRRDSVGLPLKVASLRVVAPDRELLNRGCVNQLFTGIIEAREPAVEMRLSAIDNRCQQLL
jgi:hypothetical protein